MNLHTPARPARATAALRRPIALALTLSLMAMAATAQTPRQVPAAVPAAASAAARASEPAVPYVVRPSDKLIRLSRDLLINPRDWTEVARFNQLPDPNLVRPGQRLLIPVRLMRPNSLGARVISADGTVTAGGAPLAAGATVAEGSRIETAASSTAVLELADGSRVKLLPNSLAEVIAHRNYRTGGAADVASSASTHWFSGVLRLAHGSLETVAARLANRATPLQIVTPTSVVGVRGTDFRVSHDTTGEGTSRTEVTQGQVRADSSRHSAGADVAGGFGVAVRPSDRELRAVALLAAPDLSGVPADLPRTTGSALALTIPPVTGAAAYRAIVAADAGFNRIAADLQSATPRIDLSAVPAGNWHLLVRGIDAQGLQGFNAVRTVAIRNVAPPPPPPPVQPPAPPRVSQSRLRFDAGQSVLSVEFDQPLQGPITLELARDAGFAQVTPVQLPAAGASASLGELRPGTYHLRMRANLGGRSVTTAPYQFEISPNWGVTVFDSSFPLQPTTR